MIAIAEIVIENKEKINGLIISENSGLTWKMVFFYIKKTKRDIKEFRLLDSGSVVVVIDKDDTFL